MGEARVLDPPEGQQQVMEGSRDPHHGRKPRTSALAPLLSADELLDDALLASSLFVEEEEEASEDQLGGAQDPLVLLSLEEEFSAPENHTQGAASPAALFSLLPSKQKRSDLEKRKKTLGY